jgi:tRNA (guanine-N7-)-methyltransferase
MLEKITTALYLPWPAPWAEIFGREAPLLIEIGFGSGVSLINLAQTRPYANILGVEIHLPGLRRVEERLWESDLPNLRLVQATGEQALWLLCRPAGVHGLIINFPDPWPKGRHHQCRLVNDTFLALAATRLVAGAPLEIATDHEEYAAVILECLQRSPYFESRLDTPFVNEDNSRLRTKYELKAREVGRTCYYFLWRRNGITAVDNFPILQEPGMPHLVLSSPLSIDEITNRFEPSQWQAGSINVRFAALYRSSNGRTLLVDSYIHEEPVPQQLALIIRPRGPGELIVNLHTLGFPRPTIGVHFAVWYLTNWLLQLDANSAILSHDLATEVTGDAY